jgi:hypothetical protein
VALTYLCPADADSLQPVPVLDANKLVVGITQETAFQACRRYPAIFKANPIGCGVDRATNIIVDFIVAMALLYFVVTYILLALKLKGYRKQPYAFVQVGLVYNTLQVLLAPELRLPPFIARCNVKMLVMQIAAATVACKRGREVLSHAHHITYHTRLVYCNWNCTE